MMEAEVSRLNYLVYLLNADVSLGSTGKVVEACFPDGIRFIRKIDEGAQAGTLPEPAHIKVLKALALAEEMFEKLRSGVCHRAAADANNIIAHMRKYPLGERAAAALQAYRTAAASEPYVAVVEKKPVAEKPVVEKPAVEKPAKKRMVVTNIAPLAATATATAVAPRPAFGSTPVADKPKAPAVKAPAVKPKNKKKVEYYSDDDEDDEYESDFIDDDDEEVVPIVFPEERPDDTKVKWLQRFIDGGGNLPSADADFDKIRADMAQPILTKRLQELEKTKSKNEQVTKSVADFRAKIKTFRARMKGEVDVARRDAMFKKLAEMEKELKLMITTIDALEVKQFRLNLDIDNQKKIITAAGRLPNLKVHKTLAVTPKQARAKKIIRSTWAAVSNIMKKRRASVAAAALHKIQKRRGGTPILISSDEESTI